jgi:malate dehydrogenase
VAYPKVTIVGAGHVGATAAFSLLHKDLADVVLIDVVEGLAEGKALDMMHARSVDRFGPRIAGSSSYAESAGSDVVVVTAGLPRKPGMNRDDLLAANAEILRIVVPQAVSHSPDAVLLCVTNPLDVMCYLAWKESGLPDSRVLGMGGVLDSARLAYAVAEVTGVDVSSIEALAGGAHGDAMVPLPRLSTAGGTSVTELLDDDALEALVKRTVFGGAEVVSLLKTGSAFYAPAASIVAMLEAILTDSGATLPSCVRLTGQYGLEDLYVSVPAVLGRPGVVDVPELDLVDTERQALSASADSVIESLVALGLRE